MFTIIANWRFLKKMGYKGWCSFVPFYNQFCVFEALYNNGWKMLSPVWYSLVAAVLSGMCYLFMINSIKTSNSFEEILNATKYWGAAIIIIVLVCITAILFFIIRYVIDLTHAFGKEGWWTVGTFVFYPIMKIVYGISDLCFRDVAFPDYENYDAVDGFVEFFRNQNPLHKNKNIKRCAKCGSILRDNAKYCYECGALIE